MIFIPGLGCGSWVWDGAVKAYAAKHAVYVVTLAGFDGIPAPANPSIDAADASLLQLLTAEKLDRPILVGHSLGGLVLLRLLERFPGLPPGRVVFLGTPSVGSKAVTAIARVGWLAPLLGSCVTEELMSPQSRAWTSDRELGVIAGTLPLGLGQLFARFDEPSDGTIAVSETRLPGASDHLVLPVSHMGMLISSRVAEECAGFLRNGRFAH